MLTLPAPPSVRNSTRLTLLLVASLLLPAAGSARSPEKQPDKSLAPYFVVKGGDSDVDTMPLLGTRADVQISGVIAKVKVTQTYKNDGEKPLEAIYVFPGSTRAAVFGMKMQVGKRLIVAQIEKREQARKMYEAAKAQGQSASLLEQQRPNVFSMSVANIMPGDVIEVELQYTELLEQTDGQYEFAYPAVVGPRYT
ncbi:MAG: Ca-activated chloride channel family protein, partial [Myxococcota bacterium]